MKKSKIMHQVDELSEKSDSKLKFLKTEQKELKEKMRATSS